MDLIYRENVIERRKVLWYVSLFVFLVIVYAVGLSRYLNFVAADGKPGGARPRETSCHQYTSRPHAANCQVLHFVGFAIRCFGLLRQELAFR
jgi:hypothetical protein